MMTVDDVRKALDLVPFEGYARKVLNEPTKAPGSDLEAGDLGPRRTGRTSRMLCSVLAAVSNGWRCAIYAKPMGCEGAVKDIAREWATKLGMNPDLIVGHLATADLEFFDHSWYDTP